MMGDDDELANEGLLERIRTELKNKEKAYEGQNIDEGNRRESRLTLEVLNIF